MTKAAGSPAPAKRAVWFPDTSALVTLAVHAPLHQAVVETLLAHDRVLVEAVVAELKGLAATPDPVAIWASTALAELDWLGVPVRVDDPTGTRLAAELQEVIAAGRPLIHDMQHYGEAAIIALACRARTLKPLLLSDDYDARIVAAARGVEPLSTHKLLHLMVRQGKISSSRAAEYAEALHSAKRAHDYTAAELESGRLGRVGRP